MLCEQRRRWILAGELQDGVPALPHVDRLKANDLVGVDALASADPDASPVDAHVAAVEFGSSGVGQTCSGQKEEYNVAASEQRCRRPVGRQFGSNGLVLRGTSDGSVGTCSSLPVRRAPALGQVRLESNARRSEVTRPGARWQASR